MYGMLGVWGGSGTDLTWGIVTQGLNEEVALELRVEN